MFPGPKQRIAFVHFAHIQPYGFTHVEMLVKHQIRDKELHAGAPLPPQDLAFGHRRFAESLHGLFQTVDAELLSKLA